MKPSDTQNDTELDKVLDHLTCAHHVLDKDGCVGCEPQEALTALIAHREQAAELRARIDEMDKTVEIWIHNQHEDDFSDYLQRRKATLQATTTRKGESDARD